MTKGVVHPNYPVPGTANTIPGIPTVAPPQNHNVVAVTPTPSLPATPLNIFANGTGDASGFGVKVTKVVLDPKVSGDPPNSEMHYLEVDLTVSNSSKQTEKIPGTFLYKAASGMIYATADTKGSLPDNTGFYAQKNVTIPDKTPLSSITLQKSQQITNVYLIYQILPGDKGQLVWLDGTDPNFSQPLTVFTLF